jgi:hypothetical protein
LADHAEGEFAFQFAGRRGQHGHAAVDRAPARFGH